MTALNTADLQMIHLVAQRRFAPDAPSSTSLTSPKLPDSGLERSAELSRNVAKQLAGDPLQAVTTLLVLLCQLRLDGLQLLAPQGVAAGMVNQLVAERLPIGELERWLQDRTISL